MICKKCNGIGHFGFHGSWSDKCRSCEGTGQVPEKKSFYENFQQEETLRGFEKKAYEDLKSASQSHDLKLSHTIRCHVMDISKVASLEELKEIILTMRVGPIMLINPEVHREIKHGQLREFLFEPTDFKKEEEKVIDRARAEQMIKDLDKQPMVFVKPTPAPYFESQEELDAYWKEEKERWVKDYKNHQPTPSQLNFQRDWDRENLEKLHNQRNHCQGECLENKSIGWDSDICKDGCVRAIPITTGTGTGYNETIFNHPGTSKKFQEANESMSIAKMFPVDPKAPEPYEDRINGAQERESNG